MAKVLVYNFSGELDEAAQLFPSERFATVAGIALAAGHDATVLDRANFAGLLEFGAGFMENLGELGFADTNPSYAAAVAAEAERVLDEKPDAVFLNLWHGTGFKFSVDLAREMRRRAPSLEVYGTGQKVDWFTGHILELTGNALDGLLAGLGYDAVSALLAGRPIDECPGVIYARSGAVRNTGRQVLNVDDYAGPEYGGDVYRWIDRKIPVLQVSLSNQACPNSCVYCVRPENYGRKLVARNPRRVAAEIVAAVRGGVTHFRIIDSTPPRGSLTALARELLGLGLGGKVRLCAFSRADVGDSEDFVVLREAGCLSLFFGIEALDDERLAALRKGISFRQVKQALAKAHSAGITTVGSLIFPTPGETAETMSRTVDRLGQLRDVLDSVLVLASGVYPPTEWGRRPADFGIRLGPNYLTESIIYPVKFLVPMRNWRPLPYTYGLMGRPASEVTYADIVDAVEAFLAKVKGELKYPGIPDYYYLISDLVGGQPADVTRRIVAGIMARDYAGLEAMFRGKPLLKEGEGRSWTASPEKAGTRS